MMLSPYSGGQEMFAAGETDLCGRSKGLFTGWFSTEGIRSSVALPEVLRGLHGKACLPVNGPTKLTPYELIPVYY